MSDRLTLPRDLKPGDKIDRMDQDFNVVLATVERLEKVHRFERTVYKVYLAEYAALPDNRKPWSEYRHLRPFVLQPTNRVTVRGA